MCNADARSSTVKMVKEIVDELYGLTVGDGFRGSFSKTKTRYRTVLRMLVRRGVIVREGHPKEPTYRWAASLAPNNTLYKNIANDTVNYERGIATRSNTKKRALFTAPPARTEGTEVYEPKFSEKRSIHFFSDEELWGELKRRGYRIEDGKLVLVKRITLE